MSEISESNNIKAIQREHGVFTIGSGPHSVMLLGSCRIVPYLNVFHRLNRDNRFTLYMVNVVNFMFDLEGKSQNPLDIISRFENNQKVMDILKSCRWFIHEYLEHYGMFNSSKSSEKNIYQFGMKPEADVDVPNFHDLFVLFRDQLRYNPDLRTQAELDLQFYNRLSDDIQARMKENGLREIGKFLTTCGQTNVPEVGKEFEDTWKSVRYFWTSNHITNHYVALVMKWINRNHLHMDTDDNAWYDLIGEDIYRTPHTHLTQYDVDNFGLSWKESTVEIKPIPVP